MKVNLLTKKLSNVPMETRRDELKRSVLGRAFLLILSWIYALAVGLRGALYWTGLLKGKRLPVKIICIGNLTTGGTGKTSAVVWAARELHRKGRRVAILSRGYGRPSLSKEVCVLADGKASSWSESGDEPWMMHQMLQSLGIPILVCPDRVKSAGIALKYFQSEVLLMDDGFQHLKIERDLDLVCINALDPFGGGSLLPLGNLREPRRALKRAHAVLLTHAGRLSQEEKDSVKKEILKYGPQLEIIEASHSALGFLSLRDQKHVSLSRLKRQEAAALSGIGTPSIFEDQLKSLGVELKQVWRYPDHHPYSLEEMRTIQRLKGELPLITTLKDAPRLPEGWQYVLHGDVLALMIHLEVTRGKQTWEKIISSVA